MNCEVAREALSARTDGEREPVPAARVNEHLFSCASCQVWYERATLQARQLRPRVPRLATVAYSLPAGLSPALTRQARLGPRIALAAMGVIELVLAAARGITGRMAEPAFHQGLVSEGFPLTEAVAWSSAAGLAMLITAIRPSLGPGLAALLASCTSVLAVLLFIGGGPGTVTFALLIGYLPIVAGAVLATQVSHRPQTAASRVATAPALADILLPDKARRGRRRGHLHSADNPAA